MSEPKSNFLNNKVNNPRTKEPLSFPILRKDWVFKIQLDRNVMIGCETISFTISGKVYQLVIDSGSCPNMVSEEALKKLGLDSRKYLSPYKLSWLKKEMKVIMSKCYHISFSIGS